MRFRHQFILAFILVEALFIFAIVILNLTSLKQVSNDLVTEQVESSRLLLSEIIKTPILVSDVATIDDGAKTFISLRKVLSVAIYDARHQQLAYAESLDFSSQSLLQEYHQRLDEGHVVDFNGELVFSYHDLLRIETPIEISGETIGYIHFVYDNTDNVTLIQNNELISYSLALFSILVGLIAAFLLSGRITLSLQKLINMANRIAHGKTVVFDKKSWSNDELGDLSSAMDVMQRSIKDRTNSLVIAEKQAKQANQAKSEFLSSMSHELRTPLNAVLGFSQLLEMDDLKTNQKELLSEIVRAGGHLLDLINAVLDLSKIESGQMDLSIESVELQSVVRECHTLIKPLADDKKITLNFSIESEQTVQTDRVRLKQVLLNLLSNAVKYNEDGGSVELYYVLKGTNKAQIYVKDTGKGILEKHRDKIFQPFNRLGQEGGDIEGTGIGLTITKDLLELMGGSIAYQPNFPKGSCFIVEVPLENVTNIKVEPQESVTAVKEEVKQTANKKVLYIEDNPANLKLVAEVLSQRKEINLFTAHEPYLGIEMAKVGEPDLILLDINLPGLNGYEVLDILKAEPQFINTPMIAISASTMNEDFAKAKKSAFDEYITKPIDIKTFLAVIDKYC